MSSLSMPLIDEPVKKVLLYKGYNEQYAIYLPTSDRCFPVKEAMADYIILVGGLCNGHNTLSQIEEVFSQKYPSVELLPIMQRLISLGILKNSQSSVKSKQFSEVTMLSKIISSAQMDTSKKVARIVLYCYEASICILLLAGIMLYILANSDGIGQTSLDTVGISYYLLSFILMIPFFVIHEFAHVAVASIFGLKRCTINFALYLLVFPMLFIKIPQLYTVENRNRIAIMFAGVASNLVLTLFFWGLYLHFGHPLLFTLALSNLQIAIVNLLPTALTDGYFILCFLLHEFNLRKKFFHFINGIGKKSNSKTVVYSRKQKAYIACSLLYLVLFICIELVVYCEKLLPTVSLGYRVATISILTLIGCVVYLCIVKLRLKLTHFGAEK